MICNTIDDEIKLVLAGRCFDHVYYDDMMRFIRQKGIEEKVLFLGEIPYNELPFLYASCLLFVYPSTCENCPNILIEAMACGAPILASNIEPMPEMCADAAIYFDPTNPVAMADIILGILQNQELISTLREKAIERAKTFSWENTAISTLEIFESIVK